MNISNELCTQIADAGRRLGASKILLFGSRARGDHHDRSDVDLAVYGLAKQEHAAFLDRIEALPTLLAFDVIFVNPKTDAALLENIEKDGIMIMGKFIEKYRKFSSAIGRLKESIADYANMPLDSIRDGVIQRFEFCTELAWKSTREYLTDQGYIELNSPKTVMKKAFADGLIEDGLAWADLLDDRNATSHIYDEETAAEIFESIRKTYLPMFEKLAKTLSERTAQ